MAVWLRGTDPRGGRRWLRRLGLWAAFVLLASSAQAEPASQGLELQAMRWPVPRQPFAVVAVDLDGDGSLDLALTHPGRAQLSIHLGRGDGSFAAASTFATAAGPRGLVAADFDEDGVLDLAVANSGRNLVSVHRGLGGGRFRSGRTLAVPSRPFMLATGDFNGDGHVDLTVANEGERATGRALSVLLGNGTGGFSVLSIPTGKHGSDVAVADFDRDGVADIAISTWGTNDVNLHLGRGDGTFGRRRSFTYNGGHGLYRVLAADLDRDGLPDTVWNDMQRSSVYIRYGDGKGRFPRWRLLPSGAGVRDIRVGDLNGDGALDLVSVNTRAGTIAFNLSDGAGGYLPTQVHPAGQLPRSIALADLDGNGRLDVVVTNMRSNDLTVLLNRGPAPLQARPPVRSESLRLTLDSLGQPAGIALDPAGGRLLVADPQRHRVVSVDLATGRIRALAGSGQAGSTGDGGPAIRAQLSGPTDVVVDARGNLFIADLGNRRVRRVGSDGIISTIAGRGVAGASGRAGPNSGSALGAPFSLALDASGGLFIAELGSRSVKMLGPDGELRAVIGEGSAASLPAGEPPLRFVSGLAIDVRGRLLVADALGRRVRRLDADGRLRTLLGSGAVSASGASLAGVRQPSGVGVDAEGRIYVVDKVGNRVLRLDAAGGVVTPIAGTGEPGHAGDGGPATRARIRAPVDVAVGEDGTVYFSDQGNRAIRRIDPDGSIHTLAGGPSQPESGSLALEPTQSRLPEAASAPEPSTQARLELVWDHRFRSGSDANAAYGVRVDEQGNVYVVGDVGSGADWRVLCLGPDGEERWRFEFDEGPVEVPYALTLTRDRQVVSAGAVFTRAQPHGLVVSLSRSGEERWRYRSAEGAEGREVWRAVTSDAGSNLYVAGERGGRWHVVSLDPAGSRRWSFEGELGSAHGIDVDGAGGVWVAGRAGQRGYVLHLDARGRAIRAEAVAPRSPRGAVVVHAVRRIGAGGVLVSGAETGAQGRAYVERRDAEGRLLWTFSEVAGSKGIAGALDVDAQGRVIVVGERGSDWFMQALDGAGQLLWQARHDGGGGPQNPDRAHAIAVHPAGGLVVAGIVHPLPPRPPSLGLVEWRIARYRVVSD